jgi:hypothetical protein
MDVVQSAFPQQLMKRRTIVGQSQVDGQVFASSLSPVLSLSNIEVFSFFFKKKYYYYFYIYIHTK